MTLPPDAPAWLAPRRPGLRVWALEPYFGGSHKDFLEGWARCSRHGVVAHTLPGRAWKWRMHGAAFSFARRSFEDLASSREGDPPPHPQVLFASDMLDLACYRGLAHPAVAGLPAVLYMHENQLTYPLPEGVDRDLGYGVRNLASALSADIVLFNSAFHRREFLGSVRDLLDEVPDAAPLWAVEELERRSRVLPVGCDLRRFDRFRPEQPRSPSAEGGEATAASPSTASMGAAVGRWGRPEDGPLILWNQRWEYDKAPGELFRALYALKERGLSFRLALAGANHGLPTAEFVEARGRLAAEVVQWGRLETEEEYASLLWQADVVVSTALHEFFGVAVVEAVYCGCRPVLPDRLSYPEIVPREAHGSALYGEGGLVPALERALLDVAEAARDPRGAAARVEWRRSWVARYDWSVLGPRYDAVVEECWEADRVGVAGSMGGPAAPDPQGGGVSTEGSRHKEG